jgi:3-deoxy-7-phosphoheptulonate synthase
VIVILRPEATQQDANEIMSLIESKQLKPLYLPGVERVVLGAIGDERVLGSLYLENHPMVEEVKQILAPYKLVSREMHYADSIVNIGNVPFGGDRFTMIAGPCAVESYEQLRTAALAVKSAGARCLRGGAYKPRSSPYSFQGLEVEGLKILHQVSKETGLPVVTEVVEVADVEVVAKYADAFQVGARNMQNFRLLKAIGQGKKPVILKRGMAAKVEDLLLAAEYIVAEGNSNVILCERGIRTFETCTRNTLDLNSVPYMKEKSHLPVIVDPSHGTGVRDYVTPMALAAAACGANGAIIEVHPNPKVALSDGQQSLYPHQFQTLMEKLGLIVTAMGKEIT